MSWKTNILDWRFVIPVVILGILACIFYYAFSFDIDSKVQKSKVLFPDLGRSIFIEARRIGIGGASRVRIFDCDLNCDEKSNLGEYSDFNGAEEMYFIKSNANTLLVYVASSGVPEGIRRSLGNVKIDIRELKNLDDKEELKKTYLKMGLSYISVD